MPIKNKEDLAEGNIFWVSKDYDLDAIPDPTKKNCINVSWLTFTKVIDQFDCSICKVSEKVTTYDDNYYWQARNFMLDHKRCKNKALMKSLMDKKKITSNE